MTEELTTIPPEDTWVLEQIDDIGQRLDTLHEAVRTTVRHGAQLGAIIVDRPRQLSTPMWTWLRRLREDIREDIIRFCIKSHNTVMRDQELESTAQLTFVLADSTPAEPARGTARPQRHEHNLFTELGQSVQRATIKFADFLEEYPVKKWSPATRQQLLEVLKPIAQPLSHILWTPCAEEMPDDDTTVLIGSSLGRIQVQEAWHSEGDWRGHSERGETVIHHVTHWTDLPAGPVA